jgi:hypothetical protein
MENRECPLNKLHLPVGLEVGTVAENLQSALIPVEGTYVAKPESHIQVGITIAGDGAIKTVVVASSSHVLDAIGHYWAVRMFFRDGDERHLKPFKRKKIKDVDGAVHRFETRPEVLEAMQNQIREALQHAFW